MPTETGPHEYHPYGWRKWLCKGCYIPKEFHPIEGWVRSRPLGDYRRTTYKTLTPDDVREPERDG